MALIRGGDRVIYVRVDDFPNTKDDEREKHSLDAFRVFDKRLRESIGLGKKYLLGVIPRRCTPEDILFLRNETDCAIGMHGIYHDEKKLDQYQNEFPSFYSQKQIARNLMETADQLEQAIGRDVRVYMPPRNRIDRRTVEILQDCGFWGYTTGPETDPEFRKHDQLVVFDSQPPDGYGRSDELWSAGVHRQICLRGSSEDLYLALHWTWEKNIGLSHVVKFLTAIPVDRFESF